MNLPSDLRRQLASYSVDCCLTETRPGDPGEVRYDRITLRLRPVVIPASGWRKRLGWGERVIQPKEIVERFDWIRSGDPIRGYTYERDPLFMERVRALDALVSGRTSPPLEILRTA